MLDFIITPLSRMLRLSRNQIILIGLIVLVSLIAEGLLVVNYIQLTQNIQKNFTDNSRLPSQIGELRAETLRLEGETFAALVSDSLDFAAANSLRLSVEDRLRQVQRSSVGLPQYLVAIDSTKQLLAKYDTLTAAYRNAPPAERRLILSITAEQLQAQFRAVEKTLNTLYTAEEQRLTVASNNAISTLNTSQTISLIVAGIIVILGTALIVVIRQRAQEEFGQATERWSVTSEVGLAASSSFNLEQLLETALNLIRIRLGYFAAAFYLLDEQEEYAHFKAGVIEIGTYPKDSSYKVLKGSNSIIGYVTTHNAHRLSYAYTSEPNFRNEMLPAVRSELVVPMRQNGRVIGALDVQALESYGFTQEDVAILQTLADQVAVSVGAAAQRTQEQVRAQMIVSLAETSTELTNPQSNLETIELGDLFDQVCQQVREALHVEHVYIARYEARSTVFEIAYKYDKGQITSGISKPLGDDLTSLVLNSRRSLLVNSEESLKPDSIAFSGESPVRSYLAAPMVVNNTVVGVLAVQDFQQGGRFNSFDEKFLAVIGKQIGVAIQNAQLHQQIQRRADQLLAAAEVSRATISVIDPHELIVKSAELIRERFSLYYVAVFLAEKGWAVLKYASGEAGEELLKGGHRLEVGGNSMVGAAIAQRQARIALDAGAESVRFANPLLPETHSEIALPLMVGENVMGALDAQSTQYHAFSDSDITVLQTMVDQIAIALQNANLINELQNRFNEIATLNHISQAVAAQTDLQTLLDKVREEIARIAKVANVYFALYDEQSQTFEIPYMFEEGRVYTVSPTPLGRGLTGFIITNRKPLLINREEDALKLGAMVGGQSGMAQSYLGVPMMIGEKVIGVLAIQDLKEPGRFGESQTRFLETISAEIAIAVQNTRLFEQTKRRADELAAINRVASAANTALDVPTIAKAVVGEIASIFKANHSQIALLDSSGNSLTVVAAFPAEVPGGIHLPIILADNFAVQEVFQTAKTLVVNDAPINPLTPPMYETTVQAFMITPLVMRGEVIGIIEIDSDLPSKEFTSDEIALAETLASQIANTIENSRLYQQVRRRAEHLLAAAEVSRVATSITNPDELVVKSVELIRERFKLYYVALFLVDSAGQWAELKHATGEAGQELLRRQHRLEIGGRSMVGSAIAERQARIAPDAEMESVRFANPLLPDTRSEIALPLTVGGNVMGALDAQSVEYNAFSEADIVVLQTMAEQLATAIQNARLIVETEKALTETRRLAHRERVIADVTQKITAGPDIKNVLQAAIEELRRSTNSDRAVVRLTIPTTEDGG